MSKDLTTIGDAYPIHVGGLPMTSDTKELVVKYLFQWSSRQ